MWSIVLLSVVVCASAIRFDAPPGFKCCPPSRFSMNTFQVMRNLEKKLEYKMNFKTIYDRKQGVAFVNRDSINYHEFGLKGTQQYVKSANKPCKKTFLSMSTRDMYCVSDNYTEIKRRHDRIVYRRVSESGLQEQLAVRVHGNNCVPLWKSLGKRVFERYTSFSTIIDKSQLQIPKGC